MPSVWEGAAGRPRLGRRPFRDLGITKQRGFQLVNRTRQAGLGRGQAAMPARVGRAALGCIL
jgi:hypothetical protein